MVEVIVSGYLPGMMNTHLDNAGAESLKQSAYTLLGVLLRLRQEYYPDCYTVVGDVNSEVHGEAWEILRQPGSGLEAALLGFPANPHERKRRVYGDFITSTGFDGNGDEDERPRRVDFVFVKEKEGEHYSEETMKEFATMPNGWDIPGMGKMSEHRAVCVDVVV